jgi:ATP-binding cassette subfamily B protein
MRDGAAHRRRPGSAGGDAPRRVPGAWRAGARRDLVLLGRLLQQSRRYSPHVAAAFGLSLLAAPLALLTPLPLKLAVDSVLGDRPLPGFLDTVVPASLSGSDSGLLAVVVALLLTVALLEQLQELAATMLNTYTGEKLTLAFRSRLFRHIQRLSMLYHDARGTADATYRIQYDAPAVTYVMVDALPQLTTAVVTLVGMVYVTARIDWQLALVALAVIPPIVGLTWYSGHRLRPGWRQTKELESSALSVVQEVLTTLRVVKAFGQEEREQARFVHTSSRGLNARLRIAFLEGTVGVLMGLTTAAGTGAVLYIGVRHVQDGVLTLGSLLLVMGYLLQLYAPLRLITKSVTTTLQQSLASAERAFAVLAESPDVPERPRARGLGRARGDIAFEHVCFAYGDGPRVLEDVSFAIAAGTRLAITGHTGSGKTTLASLLMRFYDVESGRILLDGVDIGDYRVADLRRQFALVLQEPVLFSTSIAENIAYARPDAHDDEIVAAAKAANAHDFIGRLPDGYDAVVGERGMQLSGGERQRVALARAFLKDAPILILDEPTSAVDVRTEAGIMEGIERLMADRTTLMIAHRLSTIESCDAFLELEGGRAASFRPRDAVPPLHAAGRTLTADPVRELGDG